MMIFNRFPSKSKDFYKSCSGFKILPVFWELMHRSKIDENQRKTFPGLQFCRAQFILSAKKSMFMDSESWILINGDGEPPEHSCFGAPGAGPNHWGLPFGSREQVPEGRTGFGGTPGTHRPAECPGVLRFYFLMDRIELLGDFFAFICAREGFSAHLERHSGGLFAPN